MTFQEKFLMVLTAMGYSAEDIEEAKQAVREAWANAELKANWINWINENAKVWR